MFSINREHKEKFQTQISHLETPPKDEEHHEEHNSDQNPFHKFGKIGCLVFVWILMVSFLTSTPEKTLERKQLAVPIAEPRVFNFTQLPTGTRINATLAGAFLPFDSTRDQQMNKKNEFIIRKSQKKDEHDKENYIRVYLQTVENNENKQLTPPKVLAVTHPSMFDTSNITKVPIMFEIGEENMEFIKENEGYVQLVIESNFTKTPEEKKQEMPLMLTYDLSPINRQIGVIFAAFVLIFLYALIIWEVSTHK